MNDFAKSLKLQHFFQRHQGEIIDSYNETLQQLLEVGQRQLARDLETFAASFDTIVETKKGKRKAYILPKKEDILLEAFQNDLELGILFEMAQEAMGEMLQSWNRSAQKEQKPYLFFNMPYEDIKQLEQNGNFQSLKNAIERHEYRTITLKGKDAKQFEDIKPIKLLFSEGNWYITYIDKETLRISRISFIAQVKYSHKNSYQPKSISPYLSWLNHTFQNSFSRYGISPQKALLYAKPNIAHYFEEGMKQFFRSQRFVEKDEKGGVYFEVSYTQKMELLPFVQRWMPDLLIIEPGELKKAYRKKLEEALKNQPFTVSSDKASAK